MNLRIIHIFCMIIVPSAVLKSSYYSCPIESAIRDLKSHIVTTQAAVKGAESKISSEKESLNKLWEEKERCKSLGVSSSSKPSLATRISRNENRLQQAKNVLNKLEWSGQRSKSLLTEYEKYNGSSRKLSAQAQGKIRDKLSGTIWAQKTRHEYSTGASQSLIEQYLTYARKLGDEAWEEEVAPAKEVIPAKKVVSTSAYMQWRVEKLFVEPLPDVFYQPVVEPGTVITKEHWQKLFWLQPKSAAAEAGSSIPISECICSCNKDN